MTYARLLGSFAALALLAGSASAQTATPSSTQATESDARPATTTFLGDTGLWFVPTAEVLAHGKWSASGYRRGTNYIQGYTNVADFAGTFALGVSDRAEIFGSFLVDTRIDRDVRPLFLNNSDFGGVVGRYPFVRAGWTGDNVGDLYLGAKFNLLSERRQHPIAAAVRGVVKVPTGNKDAGVSTGKADVLVDFVLSKEIRRMAEVSGYAGGEFRGAPDGVNTPTSGFRWGGGVAVPSRSPLRFIGEINGTAGMGGTVTLSSPLTGADNSYSPLTSSGQNVTRATAALTYQMPKGFFLGAGVSWNVPTRARDAAFAADDATADYWDAQFRIGFHPGARQYVAPPPPPPPPPSPGPAPAPRPAAVNRPPTVTPRCEPCTVEVGKTSTVTADAQDPDGDVLTYRWTSPAGSFQNQADRQTIWTAPQQEGPVPVSATVSDGKGGTASGSVTIQVVRPRPVVQLNFEDVYFDFDRSTLRPEALRLLDDAVAALQANPDKNIVIEGHTCSIGTAEYNLALGERRASSVRQYLISRGVGAARLETRSYGEERPKFDNAREETRRLNRRAALVVKVQ